MLPYLFALSPVFFVLTIQAIIYKANNNTKRQ